MIYIRKTKIPVSVKEEVSPEVELMNLDLGKTVRVIGSNNLGEIGKVEAVDQTETRLESGLLTFIVTVACKDKKLRIPYQNLEII